MSFSIKSLALDNDTKEILKILLNDEVILRAISYEPDSASDNVFTITPSRPNITDKSLQERFNEFYLGLNEHESYIANWASLNSLTTEKHGYIFFYPDEISLEKSISPIIYNFDIFIPQSWHKYNNCLYVAVRRCAEIIKNSRTFGDVGRVNGIGAIPLFSENKEGYCGMRLTFGSMSFVENRTN